MFEPKWIRSKAKEADWLNEKGKLTRL